MLHYFAVLLNLACLALPTIAEDRADQSASLEVTRSVPDGLVNSKMDRRIGGFQGGPVNVNERCSFSMKPDTIVIAGAISALGTQAVDASKELAKRRSEIEKYSKELGGDISSLEITRWVGTPQPNYGGASISPFTHLQRIEVRLKPGSDIDAALQGFLDRGLIFMGDYLQPGYNSGQPQLAVKHRVTGYAARAEEEKIKCAEAALKKWCGAQSFKRDFCAKKFVEVQPLFTSFYASLTSQSVAMPNRSSHALHIYHPGQYEFGESLDLAGDVELKFNGNVNFSLNGMVPQEGGC